MNKKQRNVEVVSSAHPFLLHTESLKAGKMIKPKHFSILHLIFYILHTSLLLLFSLFFYHSF
jgi:hypothetical protein